jgi:dihydrofolate reductase
MGHVVCDISMSLDGFITGPNTSVENPLGDGGERLHEWVYRLATWRGLHGQSGGEMNRDAERLEEAFRNTGATVMGKRMFDHGEKYWGAEPPFHMRVFVLTHHAREAELREGGTTFTFVTEGVEHALEQARAAAGDKDVAIAGGANTIQQVLGAGRLDEIEIHLVAVLLGGGTRLFAHLGADGQELDLTRVVESAGVTHLRYQVK